MKTLRVSLVLAALALLSVFAPARSGAQSTCTTFVTNQSAGYTGWYSAVGPIQVGYDTPTMQANLICTGTQYIYVLLYSDISVAFVFGSSGYEQIYGTSDLTGSIYHTYYSPNHTPSGNYTLSTQYQSYRGAMSVYDANVTSGGIVCGSFVDTHHVSHTIYADYCKVLYYFKTWPDANPGGGGTDDLKTLYGPTYQVADLAAHRLH